MMRNMINYWTAGFDEVYCISVNDSFTMNAWFKSVEVSNVKPIPDGSGDFTRALGMLVKKDNLGFGLRSWRYSAIVEDGMIKQLFAEPGLIRQCRDGSVYSIRCLHNARLY